MMNKPLAVSLTWRHQEEQPSTRIRLVLRRLCLLVCAGFLLRCIHALIQGEPFLSLLCLASSAMTLRIFSRLRSSDQFLHARAALCVAAATTTLLILLSLLDVVSP
jgi:hypothetical protein